MEERRCVTVSYGKVKGAARKFRYFQPALYEVRQFKNGRFLWAYVEHLGTTPRRSDRQAVRDAQEHAARLGVEYIPGVSHLNPVTTE